MRIVVIGHGMVGSRFAADLVEADPEARVTVLGQEDHDPYNRVMLSSLVAGTVDPGALTLAAPRHERVQVLRGVSAVRLDRGRRVVLDSRGREHPYDRAVLATGSAPRIPEIPGVWADGQLVGGVSALKDLDDARRIIASTLRADQAVVLGAGVLGLEVATGLAARGLEVTLVHHRDRLMERQLDPDASEIARSSVERLGIRVVMGTGAAGVDAPGGRLQRVQLTDGAEIPAQLLVLCAGTVPHADLAEESGLTCENGVVVGYDLATAEDPAVFAIGDCAQPPGGASGLVAQGWEQSRQLVHALARRPGALSATPPGRELMRVKAVGFALVTMGRIDRPAPTAHALRSVRMSDPYGGRYTEVVVHDGHLIAATVIGDEEIAATLGAAFTRRTPVPRDPVHLLARPLSGQGAAAVRPVAERGDAETICQCNGVTKGVLCAAIRSGCSTPAELSDATRAGTGCGTCTGDLTALLESRAAAANGETVSAAVGAVL
ncbi:FAD-dependent oxidoreductase [Brachybacterium sp. YJGR34]|uniref:FAD-dependent oxidoreductase n=1 Tax=Brachybacterium sp. YJGR34 TaxID=2059911 RepID=UPI000E0C8BEB|nr:FAD-dependent oxidoreductase [Brachybacterium sp. YJGR34]